MELKDDSLPAEDFHSEDTPNIWALPDEPGAVGSAEAAEDELEKPSFLRRLTKRGNKDLDLTTFDADEPKTATPKQDDIFAAAADEPDDKTNPLHGEKPIPNNEELGDDKSKKDTKSKSEKS
jgi:hypothetical protein